MFTRLAQPDRQLGMLVLILAAAGTELTFTVGYGALVLPLTIHVQFTVLPDDLSAQVQSAMCFCSTEACMLTHSL